VLFLLFFFTFLTFLLLLFQLPGLFDGCHFYFNGEFRAPMPSKSELSDLAILGFGTILAREPKLETLDDIFQKTVPFHADPSSSLSDCSYYIVSDCGNGRVLNVGGKLCRVSETWILDSISEFSLLNTVKK